MKNMNRLAAIFALVIASLAVSCSPYSLKSSGALNGADLTTYKSFTLAKIAKEDLPKGITDTDLVRLYRALGSQLTARGYQYVESADDADMTLYLGLSTQQSLETDLNTTGFSGGVGVAGYGPYGAGYRGVRPYRYYGPTPYVGSYFGTTTATTELVTDGVLIVDLVENSDNNHIFCAQIKANISGEQLILKDNAKLADVAEKAFKKFPVKIVK